MTQTSPFPPNKFKPGSQNWRVFNEVKRYHRVLNVEIRRGLGGPEIMNTTGRASDVREYLSMFGWILSDAKPVNPEIQPGVFEYLAEQIMEKGVSSGGKI